MRREPGKVCRKNNSLSWMGRDQFNLPMADGVALKGSDNPLPSIDLVKRLQLHQQLHARRYKVNSAFRQQPLDLLWNMKMDSNTTSSKADINHNSRTADPSMFPLGFLDTQASGVMPPGNGNGYPQTPLSDTLHRCIFSSDSTGKGYPQSHSANRLNRHITTAGTDGSGNSNPQTSIFSTLQSGYPQKQLANKSHICTDSTECNTDIAKRARAFPCLSLLSSGSSDSSFCEPDLESPNSSAWTSASDHLEIKFLNRLSRNELGQEHPNLVEPSSRIGNYARLAYTPSVPGPAHHLDTAYHYLNLSGWYYGPLTMGEAKELLKPYPVGTFLLRDSSDPKYIFALSFKTRRGSTSIRIIYEKRRFRMDADAELEHSFDCIMQLVENYVRSTSARAVEQSGHQCMLLESTGRMDTPLQLARGCARAPRSLKHLSRLILNNTVNAEQRRRLLLFQPPDIENYMQEYPFTV